MTAVLSLKSFLESKRVSELQEFHVFWSDGNGQTPARREELLAELAHMIRDQAAWGRA